MNKETLPQSTSPTGSCVLCESGEKDIGKLLDIVRTQKGHIEDLKTQLKVAVSERYEASQALRTERIRYATLTADGEPDGELDALRERLNELTVENQLLRLREKATDLKVLLGA